MSDIHDQIQKEREQARMACDSSGANSEECAAAWDAVEELQAEAAHQRDVKPKNSLEQYCDANPEAAECRVYDD
ncbi:Calvin cycle protein CP12 [Geitlerinema sp. PCC 7407]|uniref:Calvin cycle protein CP12 n=1 Tax=Geitlerinema sp. PCC 7407 TaxID=1173025 RepID=UPI0002DB812F|nr:Calvin cycle protein CP12 [Geitlerinema sp. PCC 7407]